MIAHGLAPIIDDKVTRNPLRLALLPPPSAFTDITNGDKNKPLTPFKSGGAAALTQEERDRKSKAEAAGRALAALDREMVESDETPESDGGKDDPPDGGNQVPPAGKAPSAKERRAAVAAEKKKEKQAKAEEAKAQKEAKKAEKEAKKAEKPAAKSSGAGGKRKRGQVGVA